MLGVAMVANFRLCYCTRGAGKQLDARRNCALNCSPVLIPEKLVCAFFFKVSPQLRVLLQLIIDAVLALFVTEIFSACLISFCFQTGTGVFSKDVAEEAMKTAKAEMG